MANSFQVSIIKKVGNPANQLVAALSLATAPNTFISSQVIPGPYDSSTAFVNFSYNNPTALYLVTVIESANGTTTGTIQPPPIYFQPKDNIVYDAAYKGSAIVGDTIPTNTDGSAITVPFWQWFDNNTSSAISLSNRLDANGNPISAPATSNGKALFDGTHWAYQPTYINLSGYAQTSQVQSLAGLAPVNNNLFNPSDPAIKHDFGINGSYDVVTAPGTAVSAPIAAAAGTQVTLAGFYKNPSGVQFQNASGVKTSGILITTFPATTTITIPAGASQFVFECEGPNDTTIPNGVVVLGTDISTVIGAVAGSKLQADKLSANATINGAPVASVNNIPALSNGYENSPNAGVFNAFDYTTMLINNILVRGDNYALDSSIPGSVCAKVPIIGGITYKMNPYPSQQIAGVRFEDSGNNFISGLNTNNLTPDSNGYITISTPTNGAFIYFNIFVPGQTGTISAPAVNLFPANHNIQLLPGYYIDTGAFNLNALTSALAVRIPVISGVNYGILNACTSYISGLRAEDANNNLVGGAVLDNAPIVNGMKQVNIGSTVKYIVVNVSHPQFPTLSTTLFNLNIKPINPADNTIDLPIHFVSNVGGNPVGDADLKNFIGNNDQIARQITDVADDDAFLIAQPSGVKYIKRVYLNLLPKGIYYATKAGMKFDGVTSDTAAFQSLIDTILSNGGGGKIICPVGVSIQDGPLHSDSHSQIRFPLITTGGAQVGITIEGVQPPPVQFFTTSAPPEGKTFTIFKTLLVGGPDNGGNALDSFISTIPGDSSVASQTNITLSLKNLIFQSQENPSITLVDASNFQGCPEWLNLLFHTGHMQMTSCPEPTHANSVAWKPPTWNHTDNNSLSNITAMGFYTGGQISGECNIMRGIRFYFCKNGLKAGFGYHTSIINDIDFYNCPRGLVFDPTYFPGGDNTAKLIILRAGFEKYVTGAWTDLVAHIDDANNMLRGSINAYQVVESNVGENMSAFVKNGGNNFKTVPYNQM